MSSKVFISYRRDDSAAAAGRVNDRLEQEFGRDSLFMDVDAIPLGVDFVEVLSAEVAKCDALLAIIGPNWLDARDEEGNRRIESEHDFVRIEIAAALKRNIPVIPLLLEGTRVPKPERLPDDVKGLSRRNGLDVRHASFRSDMDKLVRALRREEPRESPQVPAGVSSPSPPEAESPNSLPHEMPLPPAAEAEREAAPLDSLEQSMRGPAPAIALLAANTRQDHRRPEGRVKVMVASLVVLLGLAGVVLVYREAIVQAVLEQYRWRLVMGPSVLTVEQEKAKAAKPGSDFKECANSCPAMIVVPAGNFEMGSPESEPGRDADEGPRGEVKITKPFAISKFEVTFAEWDACVATGICPRAADRWGRGQMPVVNVSWDDAKQYVGWLSRLTGKEYRLLTEAEWEYAARAGTQTRYSWGDDPGKGNANCDGCGSQWDNKQTAPVGSFKPNAFGLYDMHGNVWEWVEDTWHDNYKGAPTDGSAGVQGGDTSRRVVRGGSWSYVPRDRRAAYRDGFTTGYRNLDLGFRVGRTLTP